MGFNKQLKRLREYHGLTQHHLADILKIPRNSIVMYEKSEDTCIPSRERLFKFADFFQVSLDQLLDRYFHTQQAALLRDLNVKGVAVLKHVTRLTPYEAFFISERMGYVSKSWLNKREAFLFEVSDDEMAQEGFKRGDEVLILMTKEVTWSDLTLVAVDDEPACVRHVKQEGEWTIIEGREPRLVQSSSVTLFGKVIEVRRKI